MNTGPGEHEDAVLAARAQAGDDHAFAALMGRHKEWLYRFIRRYVGDGEEAYDLLQETFVAAWSALSAYDPARPISAWLRRIALNKCRDWNRRRLVRGFFYFAESLDRRAEQGVSLEAPNDAGEAAERDMQRLDRAVAALPASLKEPLLLTVFEGLSQREASEALGISPKAVETRIRRAKAALTRLMGASGP
ncbi:MAG: RNA polymerase sigma factor [Proteobacteria bacterium]|nr:RNA polymerase sigma factor [Pseudomonadota bacterium]